MTTATNPEARDMFRRGKKARRPLTIADECEAYLAGHLWALYAGEASPVPGWVQLNRLARSSFVELAQLADRAVPAPAGPSMTWDQAMTLLAQQILTEAPRARRLAAFQSATLAPLEPLLFDDDGKPIDLFVDEFFHFVLDRIIDAARHDQDR